MRAHTITGTAGARDGRRVNVPAWIARLRQMVAAVSPRRDDSLANAKFTDSLERELLERAARDHRW